MCNYYYYYYNKSDSKYDESTTLIKVILNMMKVCSKWNYQETCPFHCIWYESERTFKCMYSHRVIGYNKFPFLRKPVMFN